MKQERNFRYRLSITSKIGLELPTQLQLTFLPLSSWSFDEGIILWRAPINMMIWLISSELLHFLTGRFFVISSVVFARLF